MKLLIVSNAPIIYKENNAFAYSPYVKELEVWEKYSDINFCCPVWKIDKGLLITKISFNISVHYRLFDTNLKSVNEIIKSFFLNFCNLFILFKAMKESDHIHLRCPGNVGLIGCTLQIFFPYKTKTAKYAGNWDPESKQPFSYRFQKWILSNTFLTRNMKVLVYGEWGNQSKNIKSFFTASYSESEKEIIQKNSLDSLIEFVFVGSLVSGKNPLYAIQLIEELVKRGNNIVLNLYGEGPERKVLENYIQDNKIHNNVILHGNQNQETIKKAYQKSHFVILPSKSEGWPKAIAEGMFWGCVPIATQVSCVSFMLDYGANGILLEMDLKKDVEQIEKLFSNENAFFTKSKSAADWSQKYTTDVFETEIKKLLTK